jgi:hypothetical protein
MITVAETQAIKQLLRNVAEVDPDDETANRASALAVELETPSKVHSLTAEETQLVQYAFSKKHVYVLKPNARHAVNTQVTLRARQC